ncbi:hypothetical protein [Streptomyces sp. NPDC058953]|uniref:hypothetical protein n=1 Tax=unclassified Streptomyces TaxID=2593676 RepID=UPI0036BDAD0C
MRPRFRRPLSARPLLAAAAVLVAAPLLAACGEPGELRSAGPTPTATGPVRLWPDLPPVTPEPRDFNQYDRVPMPGIRVPEDGVRALDPLAVIRAETEVFSITYLGSDPWERNAGRFTACYRSGGLPKTAAGAAAKPGHCPVLPPYYHDLTGDDRDELIMGVRTGGKQTDVRVYTTAVGKDPKVLTRIMITSEELAGVEMAGRDLILRSVSDGIPGHEYRTAWAWNKQHRTMLQTRAEIVEVEGPGAGKRVPRASASASAEDPDNGAGAGAGRNGGGDGTEDLPS